MMSFKSTVWKQRLFHWKLTREELLYRTGSQEEISDERDFCSVDELELQQLKMEDDSRQMLSRKVHMPPSKIYPYRVIIIIRIIILILFLHYRLTHPIRSAHGLWLASVFCEIWFCISWFIDQLLKWQPVKRKTFPEHLSLRYNQPGKPSELASIDVFIYIADLQKGEPLITSNTVLSVLSVDYPAEKVSCYVSDDSASLLMLKTLSLTCKFAKTWVPFCKKFNIEPRSPEVYFSQKVDCRKDNIYPSFWKERRLMKRQYEDFKIGINVLTTEFQAVPSEGWTMKDGTPWPGNDNRNHPGMLQILMGSGEPHGSDEEYFPQLIYTSREIRHGFEHNNMPGALNALVRLSALHTNGAYILNLDYNQYISSSKAFLEAMCFMMDPSNNKICYVQFPQRFDGTDANDRYATHNTIFYDVMLKALDGIQGPLNIGTGCFFSRKALYGYVPCFESETPNTSWWDSRKKSSNDSCGPNAHGTDESSSILSIEELYNLENEIPSNFQSLERCLGQSRLLIASNFVKDGRLPLSASSDEILGEAIHVTSLDYEDNTAWGREIGWIYGSQTGDILTGFKMHVRGWRSIYCMPTCAAFRGPAPINLSVRLNQALLGATGSIEILFSRHCPIWYGCGARLKLLERIAYISAIIYPLTSIPLLIYCTLPAICLLSGKFIISPITYQASIWIMLILLSVLANAVLEVRWSGVSLKEWWRNQQFWVIAGVSSHFFAVLKGVRRVVLSSSTSSGVKTKAFSKNNAMEFYALKWTSLLVLPTTVLLVNLLAMVAGIFLALTTGYYASLRVLSAELFFATGVILHLFPFLKALSDRNRIPTIVIIWSLLIASIFSVLWIRMDLFTTRFRGPDIEDCGIMC